eukprot:TRINITY_DN373_c0_g1_i1.p1 TRINITY_DN373_c0_g1~~TRINITY_DN373_c0_g1_i1.p1  ORF type:complete len:549 (+),score=159.14 TRINITY_DN373_c0_g1_i1:67-1713(+)
MTQPDKTAQMILFESSSGYALFERLESEDIASKNAEIQRAIQEYGRFAKYVILKAFIPFTSAENALENINFVSEGVMHDTLRGFLDQHMKSGKSKKSASVLGVGEAKLASSIQDGLKISCTTSETVNELLRGIRLHFINFVKEMKGKDLEKAQLGLGHSYSRCKVKFNVNRSDNMIIQSIALLDQLDKDLNTFSMRIREWYSWHFPELSKIVNDNYNFARIARLIGSRSTFNEEKLPQLEEILMDEAAARQVVDASKSSMGTDLSEIDLENIETFADRVIQLAEYRKRLHEYLTSKMSIVAPNLSALIGEIVGARLISRAGSLTNLSKYPASTVQILGAEKALFRALKVRGNTPKYGLIYHSSFIGRAAAKNKGRISRYLANKCSIASRIDCFSDVTSSKFGETLKSQVEERLKFFDGGATPRKNIDVMKEVVKEVKDDLGKAVEVNQTPKADKKNKKKRAAEEVEEAAAPVAAAEPEAPPAKKNKKKAEPEPAPEPVAEPEAETKTDKKKKKKEKNAAAEEPAQEPEPTPAAPVADAEGKKKKKKNK